MEALCFEKGKQTRRYVTVGYSWRILCISGSNLSWMPRYKRAFDDVSNSKLAPTVSGTPYKGPSVANGILSYGAKRRLLTEYGNIRLMST